MGSLFAGGFSNLLYLLRGFVAADRLCGALGLYCGGGTTCTPHRRMNAVSLIPEGCRKHPLSNVKQRCVNATFRYPPHLTLSTCPCPLMGGRTDTAGQLSDVP